MPAKSQAQRNFLEWKFGNQWVKKHHFDNKGKLPAHKKSSGNPNHGFHSPHKAVEKQVFKVMGKK
jgi:hypothetical protein